MKRLKAYLAKHIKALSWATIFVFFILFSGSVLYIAKNINFNYELESFFPAGNTNLDFYLDHVKRFESDHDVVLVSLTNKKGIFNKKFLERFKEACDSLQKMPEVVTVVGPLQMARLRYSEPAPIKQLFFHPSDEGKYEKDSLRLVKTPHFVKSFVSFKENSVCFILKVRPELNIDSSKQFCVNITNYLDSFGFDKVRLSGRVKAQTYIVSKMQYEFVLLAGITAIMLLVFLFLTFRNFW